MQTEGHVSVVDKYNVSLHLLLDELPSRGSIGPNEVTLV